ncbi:TRAP transporter large permease subunit [Roseomonas aerophila]|uniref:TRAP transporter large permease protein n=1 Tax=Teichococcus aerophilus TaxID=1224513 RepID=A0ABR7RSK2_9PROT|nr:TRAP transporter large permease subunit [Pseudoroseomonas aerophila]MBC9209338.1 TRAP transporter large permease subunit [Pseudoroseomonas aerophila]
MTAIVGVLFATLFGALALGAWVGITLIATSLVLLWSFRSIPVERLLSQYTFNILTTPELVALPLFILMGEFLFRTKLSRSLFNGLSPWAALLPGRLLHVNVIGCTIFAAISGSSAATTQVVGRIALDELRKRGYDERIAIGSLAGAGTLGFLIPPSSVMIIYGVLADESVLRLFTAGFLPGILLAMCFMAWIMIHTTMRPELLPADDGAQRRMSWGQRFAALRELGPTLFLILCVLGSMYAGIATPSEAAAVGVLGALIVSGLQGELNWPTLKAVGLGAVQTCGMIGLIVLGASILGNVAAFLGVPRFVAEVVTGWGLSPLMLIVVLTLLYLVLGCFLDGFSMIVMTLPIVMPLVIAAGFDKLWFGIYLIIAVEMAQITPPVGFNLFVIQGLTKQPLSTIARVTLPYLLIMVAFVFLLVAVPGIVSILPRLMLG